MSDESGMANMTQITSTPVRPPCGLNLNLNVREAIELLFPDDDTARPSTGVAHSHDPGNHDDPRIDGTPLTTTEFEAHLQFKQRWGDLQAIVESFARRGPTPALGEDGRILSHRMVGLHSIVAPGQPVSRGTKTAMPTRLVPQHSVSRR